jgi:hypothetical protein
MIFRSPGIVCDADNGCLPLDSASCENVEPGVLADARLAAEGEYGRDSTKVRELMSQLLALYTATADKDVLIIFNPGGWGWALVKQMPLWATILEGMTATLQANGKRVMVVDYLRTRRNLKGRLSEFINMANLSQAKGRELAARVEFLTRHNQHLKVILAGESNGATLAEDAMTMLRQNRRVFSVQTGTPFWAPSAHFPRSLVINHNGVEADTFSNGDARRWFAANVQALFGRYKNSQGNILLYIGAPGHVYNWGYPAVRHQIINFLQDVVLNSGVQTGPTA